MQCLQCFILLVELSLQRVFHVSVVTTKREQDEGDELEKMMKTVLVLILGRGQKEYLCLTLAISMCILQLSRMEINVVLLTC